MTFKIVKLALNNQPCLHLFVFKHTTYIRCVITSKRTDNCNKQATLIISLAKNFSLWFPVAKRNKEKLTFAATISTDVVAWEFEQFHNRLLVPIHHLRAFDRETQRIKTLNTARPNSIYCRTFSKETLFILIYVRQKRWMKPTSKQPMPNWNDDTFGNTRFDRVKLALLTNRDFISKQNNTCYRYLLKHIHLTYSFNVIFCKFAIAI